MLVIFGFISEHWLQIKVKKHLDMVTRAGRMKN